MKAGLKRVGRVAIACAGALIVPSSAGAAISSVFTSTATPVD